MQLHGAGSSEITRDHPRPSPPSLPREPDEPALWTGDASFGHYLADVQRARGAAEYWERYDDTAVTRRAAMSPPRHIPARALRVAFAHVARVVTGSRRPWRSDPTRPR